MIMSTSNYNLGQRLQAHDRSCILTFESITLLSNVIITQLGRHMSLSRMITSWLKWLRFSRGWCCDSHRFFRSSIQVDWNVNDCWKRIVCWFHWSRIQVTTIPSHITVGRKEGNLYFCKYIYIYKMKYTTILSALETITKTVMRSLS